MIGLQKPNRMIAGAQISESAAPTRMPLGCLCDYLAPNLIREPAPDLIREPAPDLFRGRFGEVPGEIPSAWNRNTTRIIRTVDAAPPPRPPPPRGRTAVAAAVNFCRDNLKTSRNSRASLSFPSPALARRSLGAAGCGGEPG
jgi:hypothetical protein